MLTRGEIPLSMQPSQVDFRPYVQFNGIYDSGFIGLTENPGNSENAYGAEISFGVYGVHRWKRTSVGLDYRGDYRRYSKKSWYDGTDHTLSLGFTRQTTRHTLLSLRESAGTYTRSFGLFAFGGRGTFDPTLGYLPANDYFDNRVDFLSSQTDFTYQKSARLSFNIGADAFLVHYRSRALYGAQGGAARGDIAYRVSRHSTIGVGYTFTHYNYSQGVGGTDLHTAIGTYAVRLTRNVEFAFYGGASQVESKFIRLVGLDPVIAQLLGTSTQLAVTHRLETAPQGGLRLIRQFHHANFTLNGSYGATPGNGIFLTSRTTTGGASYSYSGLRRWNFGISASYSWASAISDLRGNYQTFYGGAGATRQLTRATHVTLRVDARKYDSSTYSNYNRVLYRATLGIAFTPKDIPLTLW
jgi:hypothetical protein